MKNIRLFALWMAIAASVPVYAQTIALHSSSGTQIFRGNSAFLNAYTAAQSGDTLYLSGGLFTPPSALDKQLKVFGAGHYVDSTMATGKTFINGQLTLSENADLFYLEGVEITGNLVFTNNHSVNNVTIKRCKVNGNTGVDGNLTFPCTNLALIGNVFMGSVNLENASNVLMSNNVFNYLLHNTNGNLINNNIFLSGSFSYSYGYYVLTGSNNILNNNISLYNVNNGFISGSGNFSSNNLFVASSPNYGAAATAVGNYTGIAQTAIFVSQTGNTFDYSHNYHLQSPTTYIGTDSTEVGIYGGSFPYKEGAVPHNPHIQLKNISPTTNANGDLQIEIQVEAQEN
jgi:hypothetical protein